MEFERNVHEQYQKAYALGMKSLQARNKMNLEACPASLNTILKEEMTSYRMDLGVLEIPTNLIVGVSERNQGTMLYSREFYPISVPNSAYADSWRSLYNLMHECHDFTKEISCYEYLGRFYVCDGLKRVSVAKFVGVPTIKAEVVRILPTSTGTEEVSHYYDFLGHYRCTKLYQIQFTQSGYFERLQKALGRNSDYRWSDSDRAHFLRHWTVIETAFRKSFGESLRITAADALVVLLNRYTFDQIVSMDFWILTRIFQLFWKEMYALSFPKAEPAKVIQSVEILQSA